jgi:hypothetical protein
MDENFQSSMTSPSDRDPSVKYSSKPKFPALAGEDSASAIAELSISDFARKFPRVERAFSDPNIPGQTYCLVSFIPSKDARPDTDGVYGMVKVRGSYHTLEETNERAEFLINNIDSYHKIYHAYVGRPFPATNSSNYSAETSEVDIRKKVSKIVSDDIKQKRLEEKREIEDIKQREKELIEESERDEVDTYEKYITLRVKKAQLSWTYLETQKKMDQMRDSIITTRREVQELDAEYPEYINSYRDKYMEARVNSGIKEEDDSFIKYLGEEADLGF